MGISLSLNDALHGVERELTTHIRENFEFFITATVKPNKGNYVPEYSVSISFIDQTGETKYITSSLPDINDSIRSILRQYADMRAKVELKELENVKSAQ